MKRFFAILLAMVMVCMPFYAFAEEEVNYLKTDILLTLGTAQYDVSAELDYTVFDFEPEEIGKYTISVDNGLVGLVSYFSMWVQYVPSEENVNSASYVWDCTAVGQSICIAVKCESDSVNITVEKEQIVIKQVEWTVYENIHTPEAFVFNFTEDDLSYVDFEDDIIDNAVLGEDGYYHLNSADGPALYADLDDDYKLSSGLMGVISTTALKHIIEPDVSGVDYTQACSEYVSCGDEKTMLYPLTADLIEIYKNGGIDKNWYGEGGYIGECEDAWMFSCCYVEGENTILNGSVEDDNSQDNSESNDDQSVENSDDENNDDENSDDENSDFENSDGSTKDEVEPDINDEPSNLGDINVNGKIDMTDYILLKRAYFGTYTFTEAQNKVGDINKNNKIDMTDYILLKRAYFGTYTIK